MNDITIPDLRFEQTFKRAVLKNATVAAEAKHAKLKAARAQSKRAINQDNEDTITSEEAEDIEAPIPVITPGIIIQTIIKDQLVMPLVQGFATALGLFILKPWLRVMFLNGRYYGISLVNSIKGYGRLFMYPRRRVV